MSQAALWHVMNLFHVPDVDLLEQIYDSATICLAPNEAEVQHHVRYRCSEGASRPRNCSMSI